MSESAGKSSRVGGGAYRTTFLAPGSTAALEMSSACKLRCVCTCGTTAFKHATGPMITSKPILERERERTSKTSPTHNPPKSSSSRPFPLPARKKSKPRTPETKLEAWGLKK